MSPKRETRKLAGAAVKAGIFQPPPTIVVGKRFIDIPEWRPATLNELTKRGNHFSAARLKKRDRQLVAAYAQFHGIPRAIGKRRVSLVAVRAGRMREVDPDALWKSTLDALKSAELLVDDSPRWVELGTVEQPRGHQKVTRIILEDVPEAS